MKYEVDRVDETVVTLDTYNSDLNLVIDASKYSAHPLTQEGFAFMWAGARATHGAGSGKFCFEVKVVEHLDVSHLPADEPNPHVLRVGVSVDTTSMQLGEEPLSYGYGGTGKVSTNCQFRDFGPAYTVGDIVLAAVNYDADPVQIGFARNGNFAGWAYRISKSELKGKALFPHILTKNSSFEVNFGQRDEPYFKLPEALKEFLFIGSLPQEKRVPGTRAPEKREECEMIMMCGLPGAGKSVWAADYSLKHPEKKYNVLGTNNIIDKMKVMGLPRKRNYHGRWDVLIQMATKCLNTMFSIGSKLRRNYILDQTNVYPTAQRRKMRNFDGFKRIATVVVPSEVEYKKRCDKRDREEGKEVPDSAVLEMKANFKIPEENDLFEEIIFTELSRNDAEKLVVQYNEEGKAATGPSKKQFRSNEQSRFGDNKGSFGAYNQRDDNRGSNTYGGNQGGYGRDNNSSGGYGGSGGYDSKMDSYGGAYSTPSGRGGFDGSRGGRGGYDSGRSGRGGYDSGWGGRGGYDSGRGGRGGYDSGRGGRGGYDSGRGGRGGYDSGRGGRGGYDSGRGGRGGYDSGRGGRGGYDSGRGGRGGFEGGRGGRGSFDSSRGGRGGYENDRGYGGRGGFDSENSGRGGYDSDRRGGGRGGYDSGRGSQGGRGGRGGQGSYDNRGGSGDYGGGRGSIDRGADSYDSGYTGGYGAQTADTKRESYDSYGNSGNNYGGYSSSTYNQAGETTYSSGGYSAPTSRSTYNTGNSEGSYSSYGRGGSSSTSYLAGGQDNSRQASKADYGSGNMYSAKDSQADYYTGGYGYDATSNYSNYGSTADSYASSYTAAQTTKSDATNRFSAASTDSLSSYSQEPRSSGYSGRTKASRWGVENPPVPDPAPPAAPTYQQTAASTYDYSQSGQAATGMPATQAYDYGQGMTTATQAWTGATANQAVYASGQAAAWPQYGQQQQQQQASSYQYYTQ